MSKANGPIVVTEERGSLLIEELTRRGWILDLFLFRSRTFCIQSSTDLILPSWGRAAGSAACIRFQREQCAYITTLSYWVQLFRRD
jgi:hypothetical protein